MSKITKISLTLLAVGIAFYLFVLGYLYTNQNNLIFYPDDADISQCPELKGSEMNYNEIDLEDGKGRFLSF